MPRHKKQPWERLKDESDPAFRAFNTYLMLPMGGRSMAKAVRDMEMKPGYVSSLEKWSVKYQWQSRVEAYDAAFMKSLVKKHGDELTETYLLIHDLGRRMSIFANNEYVRRFEEDEKRVANGEPSQFSDLDILRIAERGTALMHAGAKGQAQNVVEKEEEWDIKFRRHEVMIDLVSRDPTIREYVERSIDEEFPRDEQGESDGFAGDDDEMDEPE